MLWEPSKAPIKMSREELRAVVQSRIIADRVFDSAETIQNVPAVITNQIGNAEIGDFMRAYLSGLPNFAAGLRFLSTTEMVDLCSTYKKTGRVSVAASPYFGETSHMRHAGEFQPVP